MQFDLAALPAAEGDCIVISYGRAGDVRHIVIDGGRKATAAKLKKYLQDKEIKRLELLVVTHVDADHIEGILDFLDDHPDLVIDDIWFNGWRHLLADLEGMGPVQGEVLTEKLLTRNWNLAFNSGPVRVADNGAPLSLTLPDDGMKITILSPDKAKLKKMHGVWQREVEKHGLAPMIAATPDDVPVGLEPMGAQDLEDIAEQITKTDTAEANGASIAFLAEYEGKRVLFGADAHPGILINSLAQVEEGAPVRLDLFKVPHHGSQSNMTNALMAGVQCSHFLVSTSGARFKHPDPVAVARMIVGSHDAAQLAFNYAQHKTLFWRDRPRRTGEPGYECIFADADEPLLISLGD